jgi:copper chaperone CopZ
MKALLKAAPVMALALSLASIAWAGPNCSHEGSGASMSSGGHCPYKGSHAMATGKECSIGASQVMYSFAVPTAECERCVDAIQKAAMAKSGISCAHVDLSTRTAYVIADKKLSSRDVSKVIEKAGYKNRLTAQGPKAQAAFAKAYAVGDKSVNHCSKDRV